MLQFIAYSALFAMTGYRVELDPPLGFQDYNNDDDGHHPHWGSNIMCHEEVRKRKPPYGCRSIDSFKRLTLISEGAYDIVYQAKDLATYEIVVIKRLKLDEKAQGVPLTSLCEI